MPNTQKPIDRESLEGVDNDSDNPYIHESEVEDDEGMWKVGDRYYPIDEMDKDFLRTAYYHCLKRLGEHAERIQSSQQAVKTFLKKMGELEDAAFDQDVEEMIPVTPESAFRQHFDDSYHHNQQEDDV